MLKGSNGVVLGKWGREFECTAREGITNTEEETPI